jgi:carbonic anhydrase
MMPRIPVFLVTCLDPRVDPAAVFGVELGDVVSVRNAGGRVTDGVIEDVVFISFMVEQFQSEGALFEVAIVHHSECGTGFLADPDFRSRFALRSGITIAGYVHDISTGRVERAVGPVAPSQAVVAQP